MDLEAGTIPYDKIIASDAVDLSLPIPLAELKSRTVVITGGASGIGAAIFKRIARSGANVLIGDVNQKAGEELVASARKETGNSNHHFLRLDVASWKSQTAFFKQAASLSPHGGIDCVIANAGIADAMESAQFENPPDYSAMADPPEPKMKTLRINLDGVMFTATLAMSYLSRNPGSQKCSVKPTPGARDRHLLLVSSIAGMTALPSQSIYCVSKHGVAGLFRATRITAPITNGVRVNMINPYFVDTAILGAGGSLVLAGGGLAKVEDVAEAATRLVADKSIVGRALMIGTRGNASQLKAAGLIPAGQQDHGQAVWDVYGHDLEQTDLFTRRIIGVTNIVATTRGWTGILVDVVTKLTGPIRGIFGT